MCKVKHFSPHIYEDARKKLRTEKIFILLTEYLPRGGFRVANLYSLHIYNIYTPTIPTRCRDVPWRISISWQIARVMWWVYIPTYIYYVGIFRCQLLAQFKFYFQHLSAAYSASVVACRLPTWHHIHHSYCFLSAAATYVALNLYIA